MKIPPEIIELAKKGDWRSRKRKKQEWFFTHYQQYDGSYYTWIKCKGKMFFVRVDAKDLYKVSKHGWYYKDGYAVTSIKRKRVRMHHLIMGKPTKGYQIDHINRDRMDNRRSNLRFVTDAENAKNNIGKGYRKHGKGWEASICHNYKQIYLGTFHTEEEAKTAYQRAKIAQLARNTESVI